jgi:L-threonylcarbamoyladenylate synthase
VKTELTRDPARAAREILAGRPVAFPTETVYGLGANAFDEDAVRAVFRAKGRPADNPLIVHMAEWAQIARVARSLPAAAHRLLEAFAPGPLTVVVRAHPLLPRLVTAGLDTVGVRIPAHPVAQAFLRAAGVPVAAPSANRSGRPSPTTWQAVREDLGGRIPCLLCGEPCRHGVESTVVDCTGRTPLLLRAGAVSLEALREVVPSTRLPRPGQEALRRSPGTRHRHYAPRARVELLPAQAPVPPGVDAFLGLTVPPRCPRRRRILPDVETYARELFHQFRRWDAAGVRRIACQEVPETGLGRALLDRLRRAAQR